MKIPDNWVHIGSVCNKGEGHLAFRGETDYGCCGNHYSADIYIVPKDDGHRHPEYEALQNHAGEMINKYEEYAWKEYDNESAKEDTGELPEDEGAW